MQNFYRLKEACCFYPYYGRPNETAFIVRAPDNRQFKISALAKDILLRLDGRTTLDEIAASLNAQSIALSVDELQTLLTTKYHPLGIVEDPDAPVGSPRQVSAKRPLPFLIHWDLIPEKYVRLASSYLTFLYSRAAVTLGIVFILAAHYLVYSKYSAPEFLSHAGFLRVLLLSLMSVLWHELGHSSAVARYGGSPGKIGFGLFVLLPSFYADVSEIWRFSRKHRMVVDLGGVYFQGLFFAVIALAGALTSAPEFFVVCRFIDLMVVLTLNPVFQFDGYWFLADWLALPNLYRLALSYLAGSVRKLFVRTDKSRLLPAMPRHTYAVFVIYALVCNLFLAAIAWMSYRYISSTFSKVHLVVPAIFSSMVFGLKTHDVGLFINRGLTLFFVIALPTTALVGIYRYLKLLVSYCTRRVRTVRLARGYLSPQAPDIP